MDSLRSEYQTEKPQNAERHFLILDHQAGLVYTPETYDT
jgi:hypothetical protein